MPFIGTPLDTRNTFQSLQGKRFNGDGSTTAFTLDVAPSSTLDIEVFVGNVRQDPNSAYTLSGTTLTFTGAPPSGTNNIYVVHQAKSVGTIDPPATETVAKQFNGGVVFNEDSADLDFRVESNGNANMLVVNGGEDKVGIGADPDLGFLHIKTADCGGGINAAADELCLEGNGNVGMSILSGNDSAGRIYFGDNGDDDIGQIRYNHDDNSMNFKVNALADSLKIDSAGHVTKPLQSAAMATVAAASNITGDGTDYIITFGAEVFDQNGDFSTPTFTAPVTGRYLITSQLYFQQVSNNMTEIYGWFNSSNRTATYFGLNGDSSPGATDGSKEIYMNGSVFLDMDANDTVDLRVDFRNGSKNIDLNGTGFASFVLIC